LEVRGEPYFPARDDRPVLWIFIGRNADRYDPLLCGVEQPKLVEVVVEPAHGVLDGDMEIPERVSLRNLDAPPDERVGPAEDDQELMHHFWPPDPGRGLLPNSLHLGHRSHLSRKPRPTARRRAVRSSDCEPKAPVSLLQELPVGKPHVPVWQPQSLPVKTLEAVNQHRAVLLVKHIAANLDDVVPGDPYHVPVKGCMVERAQRDAVPH